MHLGETLFPLLCCPEKAIKISAQHTSETNRSIFAIVGSAVDAMPIEHHAMQTRDCQAG